MKHMQTEQTAIVDLSSTLDGSQSAKHAVAKEMGTALEQIGGMMITGHGISTDLIMETRAAFRAFFDEPSEYKFQFERPSTETVARGYTCRQDVRESNPGQERFSLGQFDLPDDDPYFVSSKGRQYFPANQLPDRPAEFTDVCRAYFAEIQQLSRRIFELFELALETPTGFFTSRIARSTGNLTSIGYPRLDDEPAGGFRVQPHTDSGVLTILNTEQTPGGGLQFMNTDDEWIDIQPSVTDFVINVGDLLHQWSNGRWLSTVHRVLNPRQEKTDRERLSVVYFEHPDYDARIAPFARPGEASAFPEVVSGEFEYQKRLQIHLMDDTEIKQMLHSTFDHREERV